MSAAPAATLERATALFHAGQLEETKALCEALLADGTAVSGPDAPQEERQAVPKGLAIKTLRLLFIIAQQRGEAAEAARHLKRALALEPEDAETCFRIAVSCRSTGLMNDAIGALRMAIERDPGHAMAQRTLGHYLLTQRQVEEAVLQLEDAVRLNPNDAMAHHFLGNAYRTQSRSQKAVAIYRRAIALAPDLARARLGLCMAQLQVTYDDEAHIDTSRAAYRASLEEMRDRYDGKPQDVLAEAADAVGSVQPFLLAYQGRNDRELQQLYGELMVRFMSAAFPRWSEPLTMPPPDADGRIRVGILSGFFQTHSNWKIPIRGWAEQLDRSKVRLFGYYVQSTRDSVTRQAAGAFERFEIGPKPLDEWAKTIRGDKLHVLIIPELGMDPVTPRLAALRLAPVQCGSWGHPETSGFATMDHFLSSDLMEPENAQQHYSENLVRLPNLSVHYSLPQQLFAGSEEDVADVRAALGLRPSSVAYWCCQALTKYLPRHDDLFPRIAAGVNDAQFVFIRHYSAVTTERFQQRLKRAFARFGLEAERHFLFIDRLSLPRFAAAMRSVDVFLDSLGWSGCNTAMEAIGVGLPVITCPGELMRGRHSVAILKMLGLEDAIAETPEAYVDLAVALGSDGERRAELRRLVQERKDLVLGDLGCIRGLEDFLQSVAGVG